MKNLIITFFLFGIIYVLNADGLQSITIKNIGENDRVWDVIIINTEKSGHLVDILDNIEYYYLYVDEILFNRIIDLTIANSELFDDKKCGQESDCFELYIENEDEKYFLYLNETNTGISFFEKLIELIATTDYIYQRNILEMMLRNIYIRRSVISDFSRASAIAMQYGYRKIR